jgi:hypothetical protein
MASSTLSAFFSTKGFRNYGHKSILAHSSYVCLEQMSRRAGMSAFDVFQVFPPAACAPNVVLSELKDGVLGSPLTTGALVTYAGRQRALMLGTLFSLHRPLFSRTA